MRPMLGPWVKEFRRHRGRWPTFGQARDGFNALRGPDTITDKSQSAFNKFMTDCRKHEEKVGEAAYMPQTLKLPAPKPGPKKAKKASSAKKEPDEERATIDKNLGMCRELVTACYQQVREGNPDFHGFAKVVELETKLARRSDELVHESRTAAKSPKESRAVLTLHLGDIDSKRKKAKK